MSALQTGKSLFRIAPMIGVFSLIISVGLLSGFGFPGARVLAQQPAPRPETDSKVRVLNGIDRLVEPEFRSKLEGKRLGVIAHQASRSRSGSHLIDVLKEDLRLDLRIIFSPEHGLRSAEDDWVGDGVDQRSGLPVYSLYRRDRKAPEPGHLAQLDALVIDLQDVGMRYYTYPTTMALSMKAAAEAGKPVFVLDRPNPIGGALPEGLLLAPELTGGFASYYPIPTRHSLTLGELARLFQQKFGIAGNLIVVPMSGWSRQLFWSDTDLSWPVPSPALTEPVQAELYSFTGMLESFNLSVGRGQTNELAFRAIGAPWITPVESLQLANELQALGLAGLRFEPFSWQVTRAIYSGERAQGFRVELLDYSLVDSFEASVRITQVLFRVLGARLQPSAGTARSFGSQWIVDAMAAQRPYAEIRSRERQGIASFLPAWQAALIY